MKWYELRIFTPYLLSEMVSDLLISEGAKGVVLAEYNPEKIPFFTEVKSYFPYSFTDISKIINNLKSKINSWKNYDLQISDIKISLSEIEEKDWSENWKSHFEIQRISNNIVIKPSWREYNSQENEIVINIDPGIAFGTGTHPTTRHCLEYIYELVNTFKLPLPDFIDIGTGSGILAITASKLGFTNVLAIDIDPLSLENCRENCKKNNVDNIVRCEVGTVDNIKEKAGVIVSNILYNDILNIIERLPFLIKNNGIFICSGILDSQQNSLEEYLKSHGFEIKSKKQTDEWVTTMNKFSSTK